MPPALLPLPESGLADRPGSAPDADGRGVVDPNSNGARDVQLEIEHVR